MTRVLAWRRHDVPWQVRSCIWCPWHIFVPVDACFGGRIAVSCTTIAELELSEGQVVLGKRSLRLSVTLHRNRPYHHEEIADPGRLCLSRLIV